MLTEKSKKSRTAKWLAVAAGAFCISASMQVHAAEASGQDDRFRGLIEPISAKEPFKVGVTLVHLQDDFWKGIAYGIVDEAKRSNVEVVQVAVAGAYGNVREQFAQLGNLQAKGVDTVIIGAAAYDGFNPIIKSIKDAGIDVIAAGIPLNSSHVDFGVAQDNRAIGIAQQRKVCADANGAQAGVIVLQGPVGAEWAKQKFDGFMESAAKECPNLKLIPGPAGKSMAMERGVTETTDILMRSPDIKYVVTPAVSLAIGATQALRQQGLKNVKVMTASVVPEIVPMLKDGRIFGLVSEPGVLMGRLIVQYAIRQRENLPMPNLEKTAEAPYPALMVPAEMIDSSMAAAYNFGEYDLPPRDWSIQAIQ